MYNRCVKNRLKILNRLWKNEKNQITSEDFFGLTLYMAQPFQKFTNSSIDADLASSGHQPPGQANFACESTSKLLLSRPTIANVEGWHAVYHHTEGKRLCQLNWLATYRDDFTHPKTIRINWAWHRVTTLTEANLLPLSHAKIINEILWTK